LCADAPFIPTGALFFIISFILAVACTSAHKLTHDGYTATAKPIQGEMQTGPDSRFFKRGKTSLLSWPSPI
jgi:hypothetical protein